MMNVMALAESNRFDNLSEYKSHFADLKKYYVHQHKLLQGYEKNPEVLRENSQVILQWISDLQTVIDML